MNWRNRAACLDEDPGLFFPIGNIGVELDQIADAKAICLRCEVVETCLKWAVESHQDAGVWGGLWQTNGTPSIGVRPPPRRLKAFT